MYGQITPAKVKLAQMGSYYEVTTTAPKYTAYPKPDSVSIRLIFMCQGYTNSEVRNITTTDTLNYQLGNNVLIACSTIWWFKRPNGTWRTTRTSVPTLCINGNSPINCYKEN
jgi:hypothetical protein